MAAPPNPRLASELTKKILDDQFVDEISTERYHAYIWLMHVLLSGGWVDLTTPPKHAYIQPWLRSLRMWDELQPWLVQQQFTEDDIKVREVSRALSIPPAS